MTDKKVAALRSFRLSKSERAALRNLRKHANPWDSKVEAVTQLKDRMRKLHLDLQAHQCCYCGSSLRGLPGVHREHILPKVDYRWLTFNIWNLSVACSPCNLHWKNDDTSFIAQNADPIREWKRSGTYQIIHPNLDEYTAHIILQEGTVGKVQFRKYVVAANSSKGMYTYTYFHLRDREVSSIDDAQRAAPVAATPTRALIREIVRRLFRRGTGSSP